MSLTMHWMYIGKGTISMKVIIKFRVCKILEQTLILILENLDL